VNFDVPANSVVLGNPGKIVSTSGSRGYVNRTLDELALPAEPQDFSQTHG